MKEFRQRRASCISSFISCALTGFVLVIGVISLIHPLTLRNWIYPCLSEMEREKENITTLEEDMIRLTGGSILSIAVCSLVLLVPLLSGCLADKRNKDEKSDLLSYFCLRILLLLYVVMGLSFLGVGLFNLMTSLDNKSYDNGKQRYSNSHCSSIEDATILWFGVTIVCTASIGLMASFWPEAASYKQPVDHTFLLPKKKCRYCCFKNYKRTDTCPINSSHNLEPLLPNGQHNSLDDGQLAQGELIDHRHENYHFGELEPIISDGIIEHDLDKSIDVHEQSSRLRGTSRLLKLAGRQSFYLWIGIIVLLIRLPFSLSIPHFVSATVGDLINADYDGAKRDILLLFLLGTVDSVLDFWCIFLFGYVKENIVKGIRIDTFSSILRQEQAFFDKSNTGDLISRLTSDCGEMAGDLTWFFRFSVEALVRIIAISAYMIIRSPFVGICTVCIIPVVGIINKIYGDWLSKNALSVQNSLADATSCAQESLACIKTVIMSASEDYECEKYSKMINKLYALNIRQLIATGVYFMVVSTFLINTCVQAALLLLGSIFVGNGKLTPETLLAFMLYQGQLQEYTLNLFQSYSSLIKSSGAGDRVFFLLDRNPPPPGTGNKEIRSLTIPSQEIRTNEDIILNEVSFSYPSRPESLVLNRVSLNIYSGSLVAFVGHSGCGKSTIVSLLERMYDPVQGTIKFGNSDLRDVNLKAHREKIGLVSQDPFLFSGTIRENIGYGFSPTFESIVEAAKIANAHNFIETLPNKYDEKVGERGLNLSGGQKQRIAIARALLRKPALLLLDEATSALDPESEATVQEALNDLLRNRHGMTTIIIAHRLQTIRFAEVIFVMKNGSIVEQGTHNQLIQNENGHYRNMVDRSDSMGMLQSLV